MTEKLEVVYHPERGSRPYCVESNGTWEFFASQKHAHLFAAAEIMREELDKALDLCCDGQEGDGIRAALAAARVPEKA